SRSSRNESLRLNDTDAPQNPSDSGSPRRDRREGRTRRKKGGAITAGVIVLALGAYAAVDAYDLVPGLPSVLTTEPQVEVQTVPAPQANAQQVPAPASAVDDSAPVPTQIPKTIDAVLKGSKVKGFGLEVRDGLSDDVLYAKDETKP